jgi:DNA-binding transcriptional LysR family regulator
MDNLNDIVIFTTVVEKKGFSAAGRALGVSASYVSKRVRHLEESLDSQLLKRSTHFLSLTESGEIYYRNCAKALEILDEARNQALEHAKHLRGSLRVFAALGFGEYVLWRLVSEFTQLFPDMNIEVEIGNRSTNVLETGVDIAIRSADLPDSSLERRELGMLRYYVCAAPAYLERAGTPAAPRDLSSFNCLIHTAHNPADRWRFQEKGKEFVVAVKGNLRSNSGVVVHGACEDGIGIARLPHYVARQSIAAGRLVELFPGSLRFERALKAFYPRTDHVPGKITAFLDFITQRLTEELPVIPAVKGRTR